jgi:hypothetical protein
MYAPLRDLQKCNCNKKGTPYRFGLEIQGEEGSSSSWGSGSLFWAILDMRLDISYMALRTWLSSDSDGRAHTGICEDCNDLLAAFFPFLEDNRAFSRSVCLKGLGLCKIGRSDHLEFLFQNKEK